MSNVYGLLREDIKKAMRDKNKFLLTIYRSLDSNIQLKAKTDKKEITDNLVYEISKKAVKIVDEEIDIAKKAGRAATACMKIEEKAYLQRYVPNEFSPEQTEKLVDDCIKFLEASSIKEMGKVMGYIKKEYGVAVDMTLVSNIVKKKLI